ncbi:MAG: iron-sulfur cluster assembly protein [Saprospiraceae bacterium]
MDPKSGQPITRMKMVQDLNIQDQTISFTLRITPAHQQHKSDLNFLCQSLLEENFPGSQVHIHVVQVGEISPLPMRTRWHRSRTSSPLPLGKVGLGNLR